MKLYTAVQEGCAYKDTLRAHRYFAPLAKYFTVCITYQPVYVQSSQIVILTNIQLCKGGSFKIFPESLYFWDIQNSTII